MTPLIVAGVGGAMVVTGLAILFGLRVDIASFLHLRAEPTPIASISGPGSYHVRGRTVVTEQGTLTSPLTGREVQEVGFILPDGTDSYGGSPDGLVGDDGILEIKCPA